MLRKIIAGTAVAGALTFGAAGIAGAATPTSPSTGSGGSSGANLSKLCAKLSNVESRVQKIETALKDRLPKVEAREAKLKSEGKSTQAQKLADPDAGPDLRALLGQPLAEPERDKARAMVMATAGIATSVDAARTFGERAKEATAGVRPPALQAGLVRLVANLLSDLP